MPKDLKPLGVVKHSSLAETWLAGWRSCEGGIWWQDLY